MDTAALVDRMVDCFNRHDPEALATCYAPDARVHPAGWPQAVDTGTWLAAVPVIFTAFPDLRLHPRNLAADDRLALLEARMTGHQYRPVPPQRDRAAAARHLSRDTASDRTRHRHHRRGRARGRRRPGHRRAALLAAGRRPRAARPDRAARARGRPAPCS